jgi:hypothetical protein
MKKAWMDGWENTVEIRDPSKINIQDATKLYDHWRTRQKQKRSPVFKFVKALDSDKRRKLDMKGQRKRKRTTEDEYDSSDLDGSKDEKDDSSSDDEEGDNPGERTEDKTKVDSDKAPAMGMLKMKRKRGEEE